MGEAGFDMGFDGLADIGAGFVFGFAFGIASLQRRAYREDTSIFVLLIYDGKKLLFHVFSSTPLQRLMPRTASVLRYNLTGRKQRTGMRGQYRGQSSARSLAPIP